MRTIPTDDAAANAVCQLWARDLGYRHAAVIHIDDSFGVSFKDMLVSHCQARVTV